LKHLLASLACCALFASTAAAQLGDYLGPGILTGGVDTIGTRAGEQVDLRFYASLTGVYDNGLEPVSVDSKGNLVQINGLYGIDLGFGAYGVHSWRTAQLGLDYRGDFLHYFNNSLYDSTNQSLKLGYTYQKSRRLYFDLQGIGGLYSNYLGAVAGDISATPTIVTQPSLLLFDDRTYFLQGSVGMTYLLTARASVTVGGEGFLVQYQSNGLVSSVGYGARGKFQYRLTRLMSVGAEYDREHYQYAGLFGSSDINMYSMLFSDQISRLWTFALSAGAYQANTVGLETVSVDPAIAALLGVSTTVHTYASENWIPSGQAVLSRKFKNANLTLSYSRMATPGNGVYLASRTENALASYNYVGIRKVSLGINGGYSSLASLGQGLAPYQMYLGSASFTYTLPHSLHAIARYDLRHQDIEVAGYRTTSSRVTLGIAFSPGTLPLSLW
jgi:hypothetical protein